MRCSMERVRGGKERVAEQLLSPTRCTSGCRTVGSTLPATCEEIFESFRCQRGRVSLKNSRQPRFPFARGISPFSSALRRLRERQVYRITWTVTSAIRGIRSCRRFDGYLIFQSLWDLAYQRQFRRNQCNYRRICGRNACIIGSSMSARIDWWPTELEVRDVKGSVTLATTGI